MPLVFRGYSTSVVYFGTVKVIPRFFNGR